MKCERCYNDAIFEINGEHLCEQHVIWHIREKNPLPELKVGDEINLIRKEYKNIGWRNYIKKGVRFCVGVVKSVNKQTYRVEIGDKIVTIMKNDWRPYQDSHSYYGILEQELFVYEKLDELYKESYRKFRYNKFKEILDKAMEEVKLWSDRSDIEFIQEIQEFLDNKFKGDDE